MVCVITGPNLPSASIHETPKPMPISSNACQDSTYLAASIGWGRNRATDRFEIIQIELSALSKTS